MKKTRDITQWFKADNNNQPSKYPADVIFKAVPGSVKASGIRPDGTVRIEGYASTDDVDLANDIIVAEAFRSSLAAYKKNGTMLFMHDWYGIPVGKFDVIEIRDNGLWVEGDTIPTTEGRDVAIAIDNDTLDALSVGFSAKKTEHDETTGIRTITDLDLHEISIVNAGMNPSALFAQVKAAGMTLPHNFPTQQGKQKEPKMAAQLDQEQLDLLKKCEALIGKHDTAMSTVSTEMGDLQKNIKTQGEMLNAISLKHTQMADKIISKDEMAGFVKKLGTEIAEVQDAIKKGKLGKQALYEPSARAALLDWRLQKEAETLCFQTDDAGRPLNKMEQKAFRYFQMPVTYGDDEYSMWLKSLRQVSDVCTIVGAYVRGLHPHKDLSNLKSFQLLRAMMDKTDPEFAKAMYSTGSGLGDEWVPTLMSSNLYDLYRLAPSIENHIPSFEMPSNPYTWPIKTGGATLYRAAQAVTNNPDQLKKSDVATGNTTFTAETFAVVVATSPQLIEDALIPIVPEITSELAVAARDGYEGMLLNGDDTGTHRDTVEGYTSINPESYEDGLRFLAIDLSSNINFASSSSAVGDGSSAFGAGDMRSLRKAMGKRGKMPQELVYVTSMDAWFHILNMKQFTQPGTYNAGQTWRDGTLTLIDGAELAISEKMSNTLDSAGLSTDASSMTGVVCFNKTAFKIGSKRGMTVEFEKNILTQQWSFVGSMRKSFQNMDPSSLTPVAYGYAIES